jgi:hypothetical protein
LTLDAVLGIDLKANTLSKKSSNQIKPLEFDGFIQLVDDGQNMI